MTITIPQIDGIPFRNALIIDNKPDEIAELKKDLEDRGISVISVNNSEDAKILIINKPEIKPAPLVVIADNPAKITPSLRL